MSQTHGPRGSVLALLLAALVPAGIGCADEAPAPTKLNALGEAEKAGDGAGSGSAASGSETLAAAVAAVVGRCNLDRDKRRVTQCVHDEDKILRARVETGADKVAALGDWADLLGSKRSSTRFAAAVVLGSAYETLGPAADLPPIPAEPLTRLFATIGGLTRGEAASVVHGATHLAAKTGRLDELLAVVRTHDVAERLEAIVWAESMAYGGVGVLPAMQPVLESGSTPLRIAALGAPARLSSPSEADRVTACDVVRRHVSDAQPVVGAAAAGTLLWCGGGYIDAVLDEFERGLAAHRFTRDWAFVVRRMCGGEAPASAAQCERNLVLLERALSDAQLSASARGHALQSIYTQRKGDATLALARAYENDENPSLKRAATGVIRKLTVGSKDVAPEPKPAG
jgi:hypothetical protein